MLCPCNLLAWPEMLGTTQTAITTAAAAPPLLLLLVSIKLMWMLCPCNHPPACLEMLDTAKAAVVTPTAAAGAAGVQPS